MPGQGEGVDDVDLRARVDVVRVYPAQDLRVRAHGAGAPGLAVHGYAAALELGAHGAVEQEDVAAIQAVLQGHETLSLSRASSMSSA